MIATEDRSLSFHRNAIAWTLAALGAAIDVDKSLAPAVRDALVAERAALAPHAAALRDAQRAIEDHDLDVGLPSQVLVTFGDDYLDVGVSSAVEQTRRALKDEPGLGADHAFGAHVADLVRAPLAEEPGLVLKAVDRLADVPAFAAKDAIKADLTTRATDQEARLDARDAADRARAKLASNGLHAASAAITALHELNASLLKLFPRRRRYVARFFVHARERAAKVAPDTPPPQK